MDAILSETLEASEEEIVLQSYVTELQHRGFRVVQESKRSRQDKLSHLSDEELKILVAEKGFICR